MVQHGDESSPPVSKRPPIYKDLVLIQLAVFVFLADQVSKFLVRHFIEFRESVPEEGFFRLTHTYNTGSAFGLFQDQNFPLILISIVGISVLLFIYRGQRRPSLLLRLSLALQMGGAVGNLVDRLRLGHVTDFVDVGAWPIFNVADASIVVGLVLLAWIFLMSDKSGDRSGDSFGRTKARPLESYSSPGSRDGGDSGPAALEAPREEEAEDIPAGNKENESRLKPNARSGGE